MRKAFTVIEGLVVAAIILIILGIVVGAFIRNNEPPKLLNTNASGQQTWQVSTGTFEQWMSAHNRWKVVSLAPVNESSGKYSTSTVAYLVVIEPIPAQPAEKPEN